MLIITTCAILLLAVATASADEPKSRVLFDFSGDKKPGPFKLEVDWIKAEMAPASGVGQTITST